MPHLALQISAGGPLIDVLVGVSVPRQKALHAAKLPIPPPVQIRALIDTGASCTCIDPSVPQRLGLAPTGAAPLHTPSTGGQPHVANQYDVSLVLLHQKLNLTLQTVPVAEAHLAIQGIQGLLGRDVLQNCLFLYDGQAGIFTLAF
jgi:hypothetical protein